MLRIDPRNNPARARFAGAPRHVLETLDREYVEAVQEGAQQGAREERVRILAILGHAEAAERTELAQHLALDTAFPVEQAVALLAKAPRAKQSGQLAEAMRQLGTPGVRAEDPDARPTSGAQGWAELDPATVYARRRREAQS